MDSTTIQGGTETPEKNDGLSTERNSQHPVFSFLNGIPGFPTCKRFSLKPAEVDGFFWLQSVEGESLSFLLVDPFKVVEGFSMPLSDADLHHLQTRNAPEIGVMAIVTLPKRSGEAPTGNLQALVAFNFKKHLGRQIILQDSPYGTRWPLDLNRLNMVL